MDLDLHIQYLGAAELGDGTSIPVMLNRDADVPAEAVITWAAGHNIRAGGLVFDIQVSGRVINFRPLNLLRPDHGGGLALSAPVNSEDRDLLEYTRVILELQDDGVLAGPVYGPKGQVGRVTFRPSLERRVDPFLCADWEAFKAWVANNRSTSLALFRGQGCSTFSLKSSFHRASRSRTERFCLTTLPRFAAQAEAILSTRFQPGDANDFSCLLGLAQHHGLPTPLLDWSESPYIAAFFAFADAVENQGSRKDSTHVRIYGLTKDFQSAYSPDIISLTSPDPGAWCLAVSPRFNPRLNAQQGIFVVTNVADLEDLLMLWSKRSGKPAIVAADIPISAAADALRDLRYMGLTASTLFPGLDGVCRNMRHQMLIEGLLSKVPAGRASLAGESVSQQVLAAPKVDSGA